MIPVMKPLLGDEEAQAAAAAVASGWVAQGPRVREFEEAFRSRTGAVDAVAVSSCTTGLHLAMLLAGVGAGDEVIVPSLSPVVICTGCGWPSAPFTYTVCVAPRATVAVRSGRSRRGRKVSEPAMPPCPAAPPAAVGLNRSAALGTSSTFRLSEVTMSAVAVIPGLSVPSGLATVRSAA